MAKIQFATKCKNLNMLTLLYIIGLTYKKIGKFFCLRHSATKI
jgi:hypothetical protein